MKTSNQTEETDTYEICVTGVRKRKFLKALEKDKPIHQCFLCGRKADDEMGILVSDEQEEEIYVCSSNVSLHPLDVTLDRVTVKYLICDDCLGIIMFLVDEAVKEAFMKEKEERMSDLLAKSHLEGNNPKPVRFRHNIAA